MEDVLEERNPILADLSQPWGLLLLIVAGMLILGLVVILILLAILPEENGAAPTPTPVPVLDPSITLLPAEGQPGADVTVEGADWQPGVEVFVRLRSTTQGLETKNPLASAIVAQDGSFSLIFRYPTDTRWAKLPRAQVVAFVRGSEQRATALFEVAGAPKEPTPTPTATPDATLAGWRGEYFDNPNLTGAPVLVREDESVDFLWGTGPPAPQLPADRFSVRWTRVVPLDEGTYNFYAFADDGVRVWVDGVLIIDEWHEGRGATYVTERALGAGTHSLRVEYYEDANRAAIQFWWERAADFPEWRGAYFANRNLSGIPAVVRNDEHIRFDWGFDSPASALPVDGFSVRWTRSLSFEEGLYRFQAIVDDGLRLYIDDELVLDAWEQGSRREVSAEYRLTEGFHVLRVEYFEHTGEALVWLDWEQLTAFPDWRGAYWANPRLEGVPVLVRNDEAIAFNWENGSPASRIPVDGFSARWTRSAEFEATTYRFHVVVDDGARLWVDDRLVIDAWRTGGAREVAAELPLVQGAHDLRVEYFEATGEAMVRVWWERVSAPEFPDWRGAYWSNPDLEGTPVLVRNDEDISFFWGTDAPAPGLPGDRFSARWQQDMTFEPGVYRFFTRTDDGVRIFVNDIQVLNEWHVSTGEEVYFVDLALDGAYRVTVEYFENTGQAFARFWWNRQGDLPAATSTPSPTAPPTQTPTPSPTSTPMPTTTPTPTTPPSPTQTPTQTPSPTSTPTPSTTPTPPSSPTPSATPTGNAGGGT